MILLFMCGISLAAGTLNFPANEVFDATQTTLNEQGIPISEAIDNVIITEKLEIDLNALQYYINDDQPEEDPGWTAARYYLQITLKETADGQTKIIVEAYYERFGVRIATALIPPYWCAVPSNGLMEHEIIDSIEKTLTSD